MSFSTLLRAAVVDQRHLPMARVVASPEFAVLGSLVRLDGRTSTDPDGLEIFYTWTLVRVPVGSRARLEGFRDVETDRSVVSFSPDVVGEYLVGLSVSNGTFSSKQARAVVSVRASLVPHGRSVVPDGKWIWTFLRDAWAQVEGKEFFETLWSALIQIVGSDLLTLYQTDFNKSIRDIQETTQARWRAYEPPLALDREGLTFSLGLHFAGTDATTGIVSLLGTSAIVLSARELAVVEGTVVPGVTQVKVTGSLDAGNDASYLVASLNHDKTGYLLAAPGLEGSATADLRSPPLFDNGFVFASGSTIWVLASGGPVVAGDYVRYTTGPNTGLYRLLETPDAGTTWGVDRAPPGESDGVDFLASVHHPVQVALTVATETLTDTVAVVLPEEADPSRVASGRLLVMGETAHLIRRTTTSERGRVPLALFTTEQADVLAGLSGAGWRTPWTLFSSTQDFEELGVRQGDLLQVTLESAGGSVDLELQVVGVAGQVLGAVLSLEPLVAGEVPAAPGDVLSKIALAFSIDRVTREDDGTYTLSEEVQELFDELGGTGFERSYGNRPIGPEDPITVGGRTFHVVPKTVIRNRAIPVDDLVLSIPTLQERIVQNEAGVFLYENRDYVIDARVAFDDKLTFRSGTTMVESDDTAFASRAVEQGDELVIDAPAALAGTYLIEAVLDDDRVLLASPVPAYALGEMVTADVRVLRRRWGRYLRLVPGRYTPAAPAPARLWAEVTYLDNAETVENNFGLLVGLKRSDLEAFDASVPYRQAVAGLMYAFTRGSSVDRVRLGVQILLGLPFTEYRGVIRAIELDYRKDASGKAVQGRAALEDVDASGQSLGTVRIYLFPVDAGSRLSGMETSPVTGAPYRVGDVVEAFSPLCLGVEILDYLIEGLGSGASVASQLQQFHTMRVRVNDAFFGTEELALVSDFLRRITPSYLAFVISILTDLGDVVEVSDQARLTIALPVFEDNASFSIPPALVLGTRTVSGTPLVLADGAYWVRREGKDLSTTGTKAVLATGGVLDPRVGEEFEGPLTRAGDLLLLRAGADAGLHEIDGVGLTDIDLPVAFPGTEKFRGESNLPYAILRKVDAVVKTLAAVTRAAGDPVLVTDGGLRTDGAAPGDWVLTAGKRYTVIAVEESTGSWDRLRVTPTPTSSGTAAGKVVRPSLWPSLHTTGYAVTSDGSSLTVIPDELEALLEIGDELEMDGSFRVTVLDQVWGVVRPELPVGGYTARLCKRGRRSASAINLDQALFSDPLDEVTLTVSEAGNDAVCQALSSYVSFLSTPDPRDLRILPGDLLVLASGTNAGIDVGYGPGVFPIVEVSATDVRLGVHIMQATETVPWSIVRRR